MIDYLKYFKVENKVAFVTGGLGLIGQEISIALASAGAKTVVLDIDREGGRKFGKKRPDLPILFEFFDVAEIEAHEKRLGILSDKYHGLDIWVNCAYPRTEDWHLPLAKVPLVSWRKNIDMHLNGYCWITHQVAAIMQQLKISGSIINIGSIYGFLGNDFTLYENTKISPSAVYSVIKGGIVNATRYFAAHYGKQNIRINSVCPGGICDGQDERFVARYSAKTPLNRMGRPEEVATAVLFLASDAASYITGSTLVVDGGYSIV